MLSVSEAVGIAIKLENMQKLLIVGIYRSPSVHGPDSTEEICNLMRDVAETKHCLVMIGDFNYPEIDWF